MHFVYVFISITLGAFGQLFLKTAAISSTAGDDIIGYYFGLLKTPYTWLGAFMYGASFFIWMRLLKSHDLSFLRPLVGFGYIITSILAAIFLKEKISVVRWAGIGLIVAGVYLVSLTSKS